tara:strand:- start:14821 stop:15564 length:744 start_codon:yes stop_codon:yes gene_type:complete
MSSRQLSVTAIILRSFLIILFFFDVAHADVSHTHGDPVPDNENTKTPLTPKKEGKSYISGSIVLNEFRSVALPIVSTENPGAVINTKFPLTGQTYALMATYGTYITENFKTELRYTTGIKSDTLDEMLKININYAFNWYIGGTLPVTDSFSAYALVGVSFYDADVTRYEVTRKLPGDIGTSEQNIQPSPTEVEDGLFGTKFSMSWMLGFDYMLDENWFLAFEYGRLLKDTDTNIKVYQAGTQLRYEF